MTDSNSRLNPKILARTLRISTGLVLLAFVTSHLLNASLGLISLEAMDAARPIMTGVWGVPPIGAILALSLVVHFLLGLWSIYQRPTFKTNAQDILQIVTALCALPLMATHVIGIMMASQYGLHFHYVETIRLMWVDNPGIGLLQVIVVSVVWLHGCAGLLIWLRSMESARNVILWIYPIAIAVPVLALLGFSEAGRQALNGTADELIAAKNAANAAQMVDMSQVNFARIKSVTNGIIWGSILLGAITLIARALRLWLRPSTEMTIVRDATELEPVRSGRSLLDAFRERDEPHASLCQGRGRCGTCAVRILSSEFPLQEPTELERQTLLKKGLPEDARLACQVLPDGGRVEVQALYPADYDFRNIDDENENGQSSASSEGEAAV